MDRVLFEKAVNLDKEINRLKKIQEDIKSSSYSHINWCNDDKGEHPVLSEYQRDIIKDILEKHDMMMRQEIQDRINSLENKIKML